MSLIGFIGAGNMGYAMLCGLAKNFLKDEITFTDVNIDRCEFVKRETGLDYKENNIDVVKSAKYIVLAIKPQYYQLVINEIKEYVTKDHIIISIAPGITIEDLKIEFRESKIVRAMPNTPAFVLEGMSGVCFSNDVYLEEEKKLVQKFFTSFGRYEVLDEKLMNAVVCASGSSPAYVYMFIEALADSSVKYGIPRDKAYTLAAQTVLGAAKMVLETKEHPGALKDNVCSPGGSTIAGVCALEEYGFRNAIMKASDACYEKATSIKK